MCPIGDVIQACFVTKMLYKIKNPSIFYTIDLPLTTITAQKMKFSIKDFFIFCAVYVPVNLRKKIFVPET